MWAGAALWLGACSAPELPPAGTDEPPVAVDPTPPPQDTPDVDEPTPPPVETPEDPVEPEPQEPAAPQTLRVRAVVPAYAYAGLDTTVLITGEGFTPDMQVMFGETPSPEVRYIDETSITAKVPDSPLGSVILRVVGPASSGATGAVTTGVWTGPFDFLTPPTDNGTDSDGDGLTDVQEMVGFPILIDLVGFGLHPDHLIAFTATSDPQEADTDGDGAGDFEEFVNKSNPRDRDTDDDGLWDSEELHRWSTSPVSVDSDADARSADPSSGYSTVPPNSSLFDGAELYNLDELKKSPATRGPIKQNATSPSLDDTDGDGVTDGEEYGSPVRSALLADMPQLSFEIVDDVDVRLDVEYAEEEGRSTSYETSLTTGTSSTESSSQSNTVSASVTVGTDIEFGPLDFGGVSVEVTAGYEHSWESTKESTVSAEQTYSEVEENSRTKTETAATGSMAAGIRVTNVGNISVRLTDLGYTVRQWVPNASTDAQDTSPGGYLTMATLAPDLGAGVTLAPGADSGVMLAAATDLNASRVKSFLARPSALQIEPASFELENASGISFAFIEEFTQARTARVSIDFGDGTFEEYRVATNVDHNLDGSLVGISLPAVMDATVGQGNWEMRPLDPNAPSTVSPISVANASFESPQTGTFTAPAGWLSTGAIVIHAGHFTPSPAPDGSQWLVLPANTSVYQQVGNVTDDATYAYSFVQAIQHQTNTVRIALWAGNPTSGGTLLDSDTYALTTGSPYTTRGGALSVGTGFGGQPMYLEFKDMGGGPINQPLIDAVTLTGKANNPAILWGVRGVDTIPQNQQRFWAVLISPDRAAPLPSFADTTIHNGDTVLISLTSDADGDGLYAAQEQQYGSSDDALDTDNDGLSDPLEAARRYIDRGTGNTLEGGWNITVTARDGTTTSRRVYSNPALPDSDSDGLSDAVEKTKGTDPLSQDTDRDGLADAVDPFPTAQAVILYVNAAASGSNNGLSWTNAFTSLATAMTNAQVRNSDADPSNDASEIWVAAGTYALTHQDLPRDCGVYGGFAGYETKLAQRDPNPLTNGAILIQGQSGQPIIGHLQDAPRNSRMDGFTFQDANRSAVQLHFATAGGPANITFANCFFVGNHFVSPEAGAIYVHNDPVTHLNLTVEDCIFSDNYCSALVNTTAYGGAIDFSCPGHLALRRSRFIQNRARHTVAGHNSEKALGGAVAVRGGGTFLIEDCYFSNNAAQAAAAPAVTQYLRGGALYIGGASESLADTRGTVRHCVFRQNECDPNGLFRSSYEFFIWDSIRAGGAVFVENATVNFSNCEFFGNRAPCFGGGLAVKSTTRPTHVVNCTFGRNEAYAESSAYINQNIPGATAKMKPIAVGGALGSIGLVTADNCILYHNIGSVLMEYADGDYATNNACGSGRHCHNLWMEQELSTAPSIPSRTNYRVGPAGTIQYSNCDIRLSKHGFQVPGLSPGTAVIDKDPGFSDPEGDLRLEGGSPCIDAGNQYVDSDIVLPGFQRLPDTDLDGNARIADGNGDGHEEVDMGCYEYGGD